MLDAQRSQRREKPASYSKEKKVKKVLIAELLGHKITIQENSDGAFGMSITGPTSIKEKTAFSTLSEAQEAAHALIHFHFQRVKHCTCGKPLQWKESVPS
jgi:hypothetical protein